MFSLSTARPDAPNLSLFRLLATGVRSGRVQEFAAGEVNANHSAARRVSNDSAGSGQSFSTARSGSARSSQSHGRTRSGSTASGTPWSSAANLSMYAHAGATSAATTPQRPTHAADTQETFDAFSTATQSASAPECRGPRLRAAMTRPTQALPPLLQRIVVQLWQSAQTPAPAFGLRTCAHGPLPVLPVELQLHVLRFVDDQSLVNISATSRSMRVIAADAAVMRYREIDVPHRKLARPLASPSAAPCANEGEVPSHTHVAPAPLARAVSTSNGERHAFLRYFIEATHIARIFDGWPGADAVGIRDEPLTVNDFAGRIVNMLDAVPTQDCNPIWYAYAPAPNMQHLREARYLIDICHDLDICTPELLGADVGLHAQLGAVDHVIRGINRFRSLTPAPPLGDVQKVIDQALKGALQRDNAQLVRRLKTLYRAHVDVGSIMQHAVRHGSLDVMERLWASGTRVSQTFLREVEADLSSIAWHIHSFYLLNPGSVPFEIDLPTLDQRRRAVKWCQAKLHDLHPYSLRRRIPIRSYYAMASG